MPGPSSARLEQHLVKKRQAEYERFNFWTNSCSYFKSWDFNNSQFSNWTSPHFYTTRNEDRERKEKEKEKVESLTRRREKLRRLLCEETEVYDRELKHLARPKTSVRELSVEDLKRINLGLLVRQENERRQEREIRMYHQWRQNKPAIRQFESNQHKDFVKKYWMTQCAEKKQRKETEDKENMEYLEKLKELEGKERELEEKLKMERRNKCEELKMFLEKQIEELRRKNEEEKRLKLEEAEMLAKQRRLEELSEERRILMERANREDLSVFHRRQYQLLLKKRSAVVEKELAADQQVLEMLAREEEQRRDDDVIRKNAVKRELEIARDAFRKHLELEKIRSKQLDFLFDEEAQKLYDKQDHDWRLEKDARNTLLKEVMVTIDSQVKEKLVCNMRKQKELLDMKEIILKNMEVAREGLRREEDVEREKKEEWKTQINRQLLERQLAEEAANKRKAEERERELRAKEEEEEKLLEELNRMRIVGYRPVSARRKFTDRS